jgi:hypothetical protein
VEDALEDEDVIEYKDASAVAQAENADEVAVDTLELPIRSASDDTPPTIPTPTPDIVAVAEGSNNAAPASPT